jgi:hypothetical protein
MAFLGSLGKALGLGSTSDVFKSGVQGAIQGAFTGNPLGGAVRGTLMSGRSEQGQAVAAPVTQAPPQETSTSGSTDAQNLFVPASYGGSSMVQPAVFRGSAPNLQGRSPVQPANLPAIISGGTSVARSVGGMLGLAGGAIMVAPTIIDMVTGEEKKLRVTRRLRSQVKQAVMMFGVEVVAENMGTSPEVIFYILTKKMRNDGSYVTKAAVRKTRQTVRKMKTLCDMYDDLRPPARRAPTRRATTSKVMQIKN